MAISTALHAQETPTITIHLDPDASTIRWTLNSLLHRAQGTFKLKSGDIVVNPKTGLAQGEVLVDAASATSGNAARDAKWQKEALDSATYPAILFHPSKMEGLTGADGVQQVKATGTLTLRGQDHPVEMMLTVEMKGGDVTLTSHFIAPYVQWGWKPLRSGLIGYDKQVAIDVTAKGTWTKQKATVPPAPAADSQ